jgi:hypothetical protein
MRVSVYVRCSLHKYTIASMCICWSARPHGLVVYILQLTAQTAPLHLCDCLYVLYLLHLCVATGHLHVVKWLHENRKEGCTREALDTAAGNGTLLSVNVSKITACTVCVRTAKQYHAM